MRKQWLVIAGLLVYTVCGRASGDNVVTVTFGFHNRGANHWRGATNAACAGVNNLQNPLEDKTELAAPAAYPGTSISVGDLVEEWSTSAVVRIEVMELRDIRGAICLELLNGSGTVVGTLTGLGDIYETTNASNIVKKIRGTATTTATINGNAGGHALLIVSGLEVDLDIWNGGSDLDNGQANGSQGNVVADADEESIGSYLLVNWDDDDADGIMNNDGSWPTLPEPDLNESSVANEDNLAKLKPTVDPLIDTGIVELEVSGTDAGKVKLWTQNTKGTQITLTANKKIWNLANSTEKADFQTFMNDGYWIEGTDVGTVERGVTFTLRYKDSGGTEICKDDCKATAVMIHLGNAVYREMMVSPLQERCHAAIVYSFDGPVTGDNLKGAEKYGVVQMPGMNPVTEKLKGITDATGFEYWYCYTHTGDIQDNLDGFRKRLKILKVTYWAYHDWSNNYCAFDCMNPSGWDWNGTLSDVAELRCDGLVELAYEFNGIMVWGKIVDGASPHYDMRNNNYLDEHNDWQWGDDPEDWDWDMYATCLPITQGGFADQYVAEHNPSYSGLTFRGNLWQTTFQEQRLTLPEALTPEKHEH